jgi:uncharacterized protein
MDTHNHHSKKLLEQKFETWFQNINHAAVALSGGIDSSLVAYGARRVLGRKNVIAVISASASVKQRELNEARSFCRLFDIVLHEIDANEMEDPNYRENPVNRCFFCKTALYTTIERLVTEQFPGYTVLNGNNFSDFGDYRPGLQAGKAHKVLSPLAECGFNKDDIRKLANHYGLPNWNKPASPCLSSRFPYGESISVEKLRMVEKAEDILNDYGFEDVRVRYINNTARIEVSSDKVSDLKLVISEMAPSILSIGFNHCEIDQEGLISGKLNREIGKTG